MAEAQPILTLDDVLNNYRFYDDGVRLHLGCGSLLYKDFINCDLYYEHPDICKVDATDLSRFEDNSISVIEAQQVLEHFTIVDSQKALEEWFRVLKPGGYLIVSTPDLVEILRYYGDMAKLNPFCWRPALNLIYGSQDRPGMVHQSGYTLDYLIVLLERIGFQVVFSHKYMRGGPAILCIGAKA